MNIQLSVNFLRVVLNGDSFLVHAVADHVGSRTVIMHAEIILEESERVAATASAIFM